MDECFSLSVIMPALNEEENIEEAIREVISGFDEFNLKGEIIVVDDGSSDSTLEIVKRKVEEHPGKIKVIHHQEPLGVGRCFWDGVREAGGSFVCMLPGDNENDPREIFRYVKLFNDVDIIIPFVVNKEVRPKLRNFISSLYTWIINLSFFTSLNYTNGTVLYRKSVLEALDNKAEGFFFQTDILIRLVKKGYLFAEVPYRLRQRKKGLSKAFSCKSLREVTKGYFKLLLTLFLKRKSLKDWPSDSQTFKRMRS